MKIENQKELESLLKLCRRQGVRSIEIDGIKMLIEPLEQEKPQQQQSASVPLAALPGLTDEDILLWSSNSGIGA